MVDDGWLTTYQARSDWWRPSTESNRTCWILPPLAHPSTLGVVAPAGMTASPTTAAQRPTVATVHLIRRVVATDRPLCHSGVSYNHKHGLACPDDIQVAES